jgi:hypothetical protein
LALISTLAALPGILFIFLSFSPVQADADLFLPVPYRISYDYLQVHHPRCVFMQMMVGGYVKTQLL